MQNAKFDIGKQWKVTWASSRDISPIPLIDDDNDTWSWEPRGTPRMSVRKMATPTPRLVHPYRHHISSLRNPVYAHSTLVKSKSAPSKPAKQESRPRPRTTYSACAPAAHPPFLCPDDSHPDDDGGGCGGDDDGAIVSPEACRC